MKTIHRLFMPVAALAVCLGASVSASAQSILLSSGNFAVLGGTAVTSTGVTGTNITIGDVGSGVSITGFPPGIVSGGAALIGPGAVVDQAELDLITASVGLAGMPATTNLSGSDLNGLTLLPGVYKFNIAAALNGALVLDANFQNNAYWVFQIGTALTASAGSSVNVINLGSNGGVDDGIFWNAESGITIGANSQTLGNYLAGTSITFGGTTSGGGGTRALAQAGITLDTNFVNPYGGPAGSDWTGGLMYGPGGEIIPVIPEPAAFLWLASLGAAGFAFSRRPRANPTN